MDHVVFFSGGVGSWACAKRVAEQHGTDNLKLLFTDTQTEDPDLYRFIKDAHKNIGGELIWLTQGKDIWDVFKEGKFMSNSRVDQCSHQLKRLPADRWIKENYSDPSQVTFYLGIDWTEAHRFERTARIKAPWVYKAPLCDAPYLTRDDLFSWLESEGIEKPYLYKIKMSHNNCFSGAEKFITSKGIKTFSETVGKTVKVMNPSNGSHWIDADVKSFGEQEIVELRLKKYNNEKIIKTTADHRWFKRVGRNNQKEILTQELKNGDRLISTYKTLQDNVRPSKFGIARGIVFGDGTLNGGKKQNGPAHIRLCGEKDRQLLKYFNNSPTGIIDGDIIVRDLPRLWKKPIELEESKSVLYGWLAGYFSADGSVGKSITLSSAKKENLEHVQDVCVLLGIGYGEIRGHMRKGFNDCETPLYSITFAPETLREDFFLIDEHRKRFTSKNRKRTAEWEVVSVKKTGLYEEVYCCVVPDVHAFVLDGNIKTGNCGGFCVKAGQAHYRNLYEQDRDRYLSFERKELETYEAIGSKSPFLFASPSKIGEENIEKYNIVVINKNKAFITLKEFREIFLENESKYEEIDFFDVGGCNCFSSDDESDSNCSIKK